MPDLQLKVRQLERAVSALTRERDDLAKDVEQLCLSRWARTGGDVRVCCDVPASTTA